MEIIGSMVNGQALGSEDIKLSHRLLQQVQVEGYPPSCFLRKAASRLSSIWARSGYSKRGAHSWRGDTSTLPHSPPLFKPLIVVGIVAGC